jgi:hypothetical protein
MDPIVAARVTLTNIRNGTSPLVSKGNLVIDNSITDPELIAAAEKGQYITSADAKAVYDYATKDSTEALAAIEDYKLDESAPMINWHLTPENDRVAQRWTAQLLSGEGLEDVQALMSAAYDVAGDGGSCLDVGMAYGAQYFAMKRFYPQVVWSGVEVAQQYIDKFRKLITDGSNPEVFKVDSYLNMSGIKDESYDVVTGRSVLSHYSPEHAFKIIDEMLRIAKKAIVLKLYIPPKPGDDDYRLGDGNMTGRGYFVTWSDDKWQRYLVDKKWSTYQVGNVYVINK